jgi:hypothetical protein
MGKYTVGLPSLKRSFTGRPSSIMISLKELKLSEPFLSSAAMTAFLRLQSVRIR